MCGIAFLSKNISNLKDNKTFINRLKIRGPDDFSVVKTGLGDLFHSRLQIVGGAGSRQPFRDVESQVSVVVNGEIFNYRDLRSSLSSRGRRFNTKSDCEVLLHGYLEFGLAFIPQMEGQFAFIIIDERHSILYAGRDRVGEKPLFYNFSPGRSPSLAISSDARALASLQPNVELNSGVIRDFFAYQFIPENKSIFTNLHKVEPGSVIGFDLLSQETRQVLYWDITQVALSAGRADYSNGVNELNEVVYESVVSSCLGDEPPGVALSGGVDSSLIASICMDAGIDVSAFSIGQKKSSLLDESDQAFNYARELGLNFSASFASEASLLSNFGLAVDAMDEPFGDVSALNYFALGRMARRCGYRSVLTGHGADELFWGYQWVWQAASNSIAKSSGRNVFSQGAAYRFVLENTSSLFGQRLSSDDLYATTGCSKLDSLHEAFVSLFNLYLRSNGAAQIDRMFMASGVEARSPFLDKRLIETICSHPNLFYPSNPKALLKTAASKWVPVEILNRQKRGFQAPINRWISLLLREESFLLSHQSFLSRNQILNLPLILDQFGKGNRAVDNILWCGLVFEKWIQSFDRDVWVN